MNIKTLLAKIYCKCTNSLTMQTKLGENIIDLTYPYDESTIYWPTEKGFRLEPIFNGFTPQGYFYSSFKFCTPEHGGTHVDAPLHFAQHGYSVDTIPFMQLFGNAVVISVANQADKHPDYAVTLLDIQNFEQKHRCLDHQDIVLFYTGWGKYWSDKKKYLGTDIFGDINNLHFPGISRQAAEYLVLRKVKGVGIDTASLDPGSGSNDFWAHRTILGANIYGIENIANLDLLPTTGARLVVAPMKIAGGSGGPTRLLAFV